MDPTFQSSLSRSPSPNQYLRKYLGVTSSPCRPPTPPDLSPEVLINQHTDPLLPLGVPSNEVPVLNPTSSNHNQGGHAVLMPLAEASSTQIATESSHVAAQDHPVNQTRHDQLPSSFSKRKRAISEGPMASTSNISNFRYPPPVTRAFSQAPSKPGPLAAANKSGLSRQEIERTTRAVHVQTLIQNSLVIKQATELPLLPPAAIEHLQAAIEILNSRKEGEPNFLSARLCLNALVLLTFLLPRRYLSRNSSSSRGRDRNHRSHRRT